MVFTDPVLADPVLADPASPPPPPPTSTPPATMRLSRRTALAGITASVLLIVAGCTTPTTTSPADLIAGDALGPLYDETRTLIVAYDQALDGAPALVGLLGPLREEHRQHLVALASLIGVPVPEVSAGPDPTGIALPRPDSSGAAGATTTPRSGGPARSGTSSPPAPTGASGAPATNIASTKAALASAEKTAQTNAVAACLTAEASRVAVLASIAACRATHVAALR